MIGTASLMAIGVFLCVVGFTLCLSFALGRRAQDSSGYFAAHGQIPWFVNGVAFAGDYLSAASFLGICGMIAFYGYDGFLYSIGYLAGWIVALFVIAEPMKRLGQFTFADALNAKFQSRGIQLAVGISTLTVSIFYLIPQMVGAGVLVQPLLGLPHWLGVVLVGSVVIFIVVSAGMVSTTWVQFIKGSLLVIFSALLTAMILFKGLEVSRGGIDGYEFTTVDLGSVELGDSEAVALQLHRQGFLRDGKGVPDAWQSMGFWKLVPIENELRPSQGGTNEALICRLVNTSEGAALLECQVVAESSSSTVAYNPGTDDGTFDQSSVERNTWTKSSLHPVGYVSRLPGNIRRTGPLSPWRYLQTLSDSEIVLWEKKELQDSQGQKLAVYFPKPTPGRQLTRPGEHPTFAGIRQNEFWPKLNFLSLMFALFCGTASLPHILIRYYTVRDEAAARKSTIVGIATIGSFYILTLYMGLGAMTSGALDMTNENMSAPLLARSISEWLFAIISAIAFTTVLGTVSGLILASAGAVSHDLLKNGLSIEMSDVQQVRVAKLASVVVGLLAIVLGIAFQKMNVSYLVGWAFSIAASANLPALIMLLFWRRTTRHGIIAAVLIGMASSLGWILLSDETFSKVYGVVRPEAIAAFVPFSQPGILTIPLSFLTLVVVSLFTGNGKQADFGQPLRGV
jgi:cation/acetate symporter